MKIENSYKRINRNLGIEILRMILCFWVISFHCLNKNNISYFLYFITKTKFYHVPCFSFISFYYSYNIFCGASKKNVLKRLERLLIPYIVWPLLIFLKHNIIHFIFNNSGRYISFHDLKIQLITGWGFVIPLWFLFSIAFLSLFFFILSNIFRKYFLLITQLLALLSYIMQYSQIYDCLNNYKKNIKMPIIFSISIFPISVFGLSFASLELMNTLKLNRYKTIFFSFVILILMLKYRFFVVMNGYEGIEYIFSSLFLFIGFYLIPLEKAFLQFQILIKYITRYTNGIYCLQGHVFSLVKLKIDKKGTFKTSVISYIILYFISFIGSKISGKSKFKYLFE